MLVDDVVITVKAGNGGNGAVTFEHRRGSIKTPPDGGNGGNGGSIYLQGSSQISDLSQFSYKKKQEAESGTPGKKSNLYGKNGEDAVILLPFGTEVRDGESNELLLEIVDDEKICIAKGGRGGIGNKEFTKKGYHGHQEPQEGLKGEERILHLVMRLVADVGLVGLPNAGKSTLLSVLTAAHPKIGAYPFTTLEPNLGVMEKIVIADIPGLIEGASRGKGLGITFLRHIEKTELLLHLIDATDEDVIGAYEKIRNEFSEFSESLARKEEMIVLTKKDLVTQEELTQKVQHLKKIK
jgi:GTP-binding protein